MVNIYAIVACKNDLYASKQINDDEGKAFAISINGIFQSTSAKSNSGIEILFDNIGHRIFNPNFDINALESKEKEEYAKTKQEMKQKNQKQPQNNRGVKLEANKTKPQKKRKSAKSIVIFRLIIILE